MTARLPVRACLRVLAPDRDTPATPTPDLVRRVLQEGRRTEELVIVDVPRTLDPAAVAALSLARRVYLVVPAQLRAIAAAAQVARTLRVVAGDMQAVVRGPGAQRHRTGGYRPDNGHSPRRPDARGAWPAARLRTRSRARAATWAARPALCPAARRARPQGRANGRMTPARRPARRPAARSGRDRRPRQRPAAGVGRSRSGFGTRTTRVLQRRRRAPPRGQARFDGRSQARRRQARSSMPGWPAESGCTRCCLRWRSPASTCRFAFTGQARWTSPLWWPAAACTPRSKRCLDALIAARMAFVISGGAGTGKTTLLGALLARADPAERILIVEDTAELTVDHPHVVRLSGPAPERRRCRRDHPSRVWSARPCGCVPTGSSWARPEGMSCSTCCSPRNTGHDGSLTTVHANGVADVPARVEALAMLAGVPRPAAHSLLASALRVAVHLQRGRDGARRVGQIAVLERDGELVRAITALSWDGASNEVQLGAGCALAPRLDPVLTLAAAGCVAGGCLAADRHPFRSAAAVAAQPICGAGSLSSARQPEGRRDRDGACARGADRSGARSRRRLGGLRDDAPGRQAAAAKAGAGDSGGRPRRACGHSRPSSAAAFRRRRHCAWSRDRPVQRKGWAGACSPQQRPTRQAATWPRHCAGSRHPARLQPRCRLPGRCASAPAAAWPVRFGASRRALRQMFVSSEKRRRRSRRRGRAPACSPYFRSPGLPWGSFPERAQPTYFCTRG